MTESKFLNCVLIESIVFLLLGLSLLILPKVTFISFGVMMCLSFIIYGGYKIINTILSKNFSKHFILDIITGLVLLINGIFLFVAPVLDITLIIGISGIFFILKSLSSSAFAIQVRKTLNFWWMCLFLSVLELLFGMIIIVMLQVSGLWLVGIITGIDFIFSGTIYVNMYISTKYLKG